MKDILAVFISRQTKRTSTLLLLSALLSLSGCLTEESQPQEQVQVTPSPPQTSNSPPVITGAPSVAVTVGDIYSFTPTATDPDGDTLTFEIQNAPRWAEFDSATGRLFGSPTIADIGQNDNIRISVSDGSATSALPAFSVEVASVALGSLTVSWIPPTENEDGTALTDLAGYKLYYGVAANQLDRVIEINSPGITTYVVENLSPNTYFFSATSLNSLGIESDLSDVASGVVQ